MPRKRGEYIPCHRIPDYMTYKELWKAYMGSSPPPDYLQQIKEGRIGNLSMKELDGSYWPSPDSFVSNKTLQEAKRSTIGIVSIVHGRGTIERRSGLKSPSGNVAYITSKTLQSIF